MKSALLLASRLAVACLCGLLATPADGATVGGTWLLNTPVPDNSALGLSDARQLNTDIASITAVTVTLRIAGGWAGDLFAYVVHNSGYAVLLNRIGRSTSNPLGNSASGLDATFADSAPADIHLVPNSVGILTGNYQPDGRTADASVVLGTSPRTAMLSSFNGLAAGGVWTLFVADTSPGSEATVQSWELQITGTVPEPGVTVLSMWSLCLLCLRRRRASVN
jgi:hypothetical protein